MSNKILKYAIVGVVVLLIIVISLVVSYRNTNTSINYGIDNSALVYDTVSSGGGGASGGGESSGSGPSGSGASGSGDGYSNQDPNSVTLTLTFGEDAGEDDRFAETTLTGTNVSKGVHFYNTEDGKTKYNTRCDTGDFLTGDTCILKYKKGQSVSLRIGSKRLSGEIGEPVALWTSKNILPCQKPIGLNINISRNCDFVIREHTNMTVSFFDGEVKRTSGHQTDPFQYVVGVPYRYLDSTSPFYMDKSGLLRGAYTLGLKQIGPGDLDVLSGNYGARYGGIISTPDDKGALDYFKLYRAYGGETLKLEANPSSYAKYGGVTYVNNWYGACSGTGTTCMVKMNGNKNVTAQSKPSINKKVVYLSVNPNHDVTFTGYLINGKPYDLLGYEKIAFYLDSKVTITTSETGRTNVHWSGSCSGPVSQPCTLVMDSDKTISQTLKDIEE
jgi:hypothetical protein